MRRAGSVLGSMVAAGVVLAGCGEQLPTYRYQMTVEVETPEGLKSGSSVIEVWTKNESSFLSSGGIRSGVRGEAVTVDLGPRGILFALLNSPDGRTGAGGYAWALIPERPDKGGNAEALRNNMRALKAVTGARPLPREYYPRLVRFRDMRDPRTVEAIDPENLGKSFGKGAKLQRIIVTITDDPVTKGIEKRLRWLPTQQGALLKGTGNTPIGDLPLAGQLNDGDFWRGANQ